MDVRQRKIAPASLPVGCILLSAVLFSPPGNAASPDGTLHYHAEEDSCAFLYYQWAATALLTDFFIGHQGYSCPDQIHSGSQDTATDPQYQDAKDLADLAPTGAVTFDQ